MKGKQKLFYLPEAHTDFILSVVGEELGFLGVMVITAMFFLLVQRGMRVAIAAEDNFGRFSGLRHRGAARHRGVRQHGGGDRTAPHQGACAPLHQLRRQFPDHHPVCRRDPANISSRMRGDAMRLLIAGGGTGGHLSPASRWPRSSWPGTRQRGAVRRHRAGHRGAGASPARLPAGVDLRPEFGGKGWFPS